MIIRPRRWTKKEPPIKFILINGRYVCRCGNVVAVSPRMDETIKDDGTFKLPEGYYNADDIILILPDELKFDYEILND